MRQFALSLLLLCNLFSLALAEEVIRNFASKIDVASDGTLRVEETITVRAEGAEIKRGIQRDFPTSYADRFGQRVVVGFDVVSVERNGRDEPWQIISVSNGKRVRIGNADVFLNRGEHTYKIIYETTRQIGFFETYDELYWNVTGNGWTFPIEKASATVNLPSGAEIKQHSVYTGRMGETGSAANVDVAAGKRFSATTNRPLEVGEGLTIAVAWQKGIVIPPTAAEKQMSWIKDNLWLFALGILWPVVAFYYYFAWNKVGRDPPKGNIYPLFHPPEGLGPAGVRYVWKQRFDDQGFAAALVGLAVKRRLKISDVDGDYSIAKLENTSAKLTSSEQELLKYLPSSSLALEQSNNSQIIQIKSALSSSLDNEYDGAMFLRNTRYFVLGALLSIIGLVVAGLLLPQGDGAIAVFATGFSSLWWSVIFAVGWGSVKGLFSANSIFTRIKSLMSALFLLPFVVAGLGIPAAIILEENNNPTMIIFIVASVGMFFFNLIFYWLLKAPTPKGRQMLDAIEGFKMYLETAEEERLKVLHPPEKTPELFERYLPYAMALDCENAWNAKFTAVLAAAAAAAGTAASHPGWYHGRNWNSGSFTKDLSSGLTSSISSSSIAPGSSSGSSGGGSSGGGGGGGGGSGW